MQCVSNEKIKMLKIFQLPCNNDNESWWGSQVRKKAYVLAFLNYYSHSTSVHRTYTVNDDFYMVLAFNKSEIMHRFYHLLGVTMKTIRVMSPNGD